MKLYIADIYAGAGRVDHFVTFANSEEEAKETILANVRKCGTPEDEVEDVKIALDETLAEHPHRVVVITGLL